MDRVDAPTRVIVADDDVLLREGVASLLERSGFDVVGQAGDGASCSLSVANRSLSSCSWTSACRPIISPRGLDAAKAIREALPGSGSWSCLLAEDPGDRCR
jgi:DNA-binding NarL/FixJ family response regulator